MTRRGLIQRALLILASGPLGLIGCTSRKIASRLSPPAPAALAPASAPGPLSAAEMEGLVAFGEVLVEGRALAPADRRTLVAHIEDQAGRSADRLSLYRSAAGTLDRLAGGRFASLEVRERIDLVARHRLAASASGSGEDPGPLAEQMRALRTRAVPDLIRGYYGSPAGWAVAGYDAFPGRCGELTRYTRPES